MSIDISGKKILVTGSCGFVASHVIKQLLEKGCNVRGTVRSLSSKDHLQYEERYPQFKGQLEFVEADLLTSSCWDNVVKGCDYVMHVASPVLY